MRDGRISLPASLLWLGIGLLSLFPAPLAPLARLYHALCTPFPALSALSRLMPPLPLALMLLLLLIVVGVGIAAGLRELIGAFRIARGLDRLAAPAPPRLARAIRRLDLEGQAIYLMMPNPAALCFGFLKPRIAITSGLVDRLDDEELTAVLLHERHHLRRRDPLRYLALHTLATALFMAPLAAAARDWAETRIELAADRAALQVVPRGALAGALVSALDARSVLTAAIASLSATEARIVQLTGHGGAPTVPVAATLATAGFAAGTTLAIMLLARGKQVRELLCALCPDLI